MGVAIFLRSEESTNNFREAILNTIRDPQITYMVLTYPYFYEKKPYYVDDPASGGKIKKNAKYSILDDALSRTILSRTDFQIRTISSKSDAMWKESYMNFIKKLNKAIMRSKKNIDFKGYVVKDKAKGKLHAKVMVACKKIENKTVPVAMLIGSSNLTNRAFGLEKWFNYETDVFLWNANYRYDEEKFGGETLPPIVCREVEGSVEEVYIKEFWKEFVDNYKNLIEIEDMDRGDRNL